MEEFILKKVFELRDSDNSSSTDSSESSDTDSDLELLQEEERKKIRIANYVSEVVPRYTDNQFQEHFRLNRTDTEILLQQLQQDEKPGKTRDIKAEFLLTLWTLANQESFRGIGDRFGVEKGHAHSIFINMCKTLCKLAHMYIQWPANGTVKKTVDDFNTLRGNRSFPNVLGCVDGCHISIPGPRQDNSYYNRKGFHSVVLQGICNSKLEFINIFCGWPGSSHDARIWQNSPIYV